jgi:hypothetical protein
VNHASAAAQPQIDKRALLHTVSHRIVRVVAAESTPYAEALFGVLLDRFGPCVDPDEWNEVDACELTVGEARARGRAQVLICACLVLRGPPPFRWSTAAIAVLCFLVAATFDPRRRVPRDRVDDPVSIVDAMRFANGELGVFFKQLQPLAATDEETAH